MTTFDGFIPRDQETRIDAALDDHCRQFGLTPLDAVKHFPVLARRQLLKRFLAQSELFKRTLEVPGDIAELGVFRGLGLMTWANLLECYCIGDRTKTVYGFENWQGFQSIAQQDGGEDPAMQRHAGGYSPADHRQELLNAIAIFDQDRFIPQKPRIRLVDGDIVESVPRFVAENPGVRFSLVHFDCDLYRPTRVALASLWPVICRGGVLIFDEYAIKDWPGETRAVDEFLEQHPGLRLHTFDWTNAPAAYLIKP